MRLQRRLWVAAAVGVSSLVVPVVLPAGGARMTSTVVSPGSATDFIVSPTACWVRVQLVGGSGQTAATASQGATGGAGGLINGYLAVGPNQQVHGGDTLTVSVGYGGANGGSGAAASGTGGTSGGGATAVSKAGTVRAVAGGGGGTAALYAFSQSGGKEAVLVASLEPRRTTAASEDRGQQECSAASRQPRVERHRPRGLELPSRRAQATLKGRPGD